MFQILRSEELPFHEGETGNTQCLWLQVISEKENAIRTV